MTLAVSLSSDHSGWNMQVLLALLMVASSVAVVVKWVRLPYSIALVIAGLAVGLFHLLPSVEMTPELVLVVLLPALLFEATWNIRASDLRADWLPISVLATVGVIISTVVVAGFMLATSNLALGACLLFGAMISATDPISVLSLFKRLGVSKRLTMIVEGESLFNDGTAVVVFKLCLAFSLAGLNLSFVGTTLAFVEIVGGGILLGLLLGWLASRITSYFDDHLLEVTFTAILAYGTYLLAEAVHVSPVLATTFAGLVMSNYGSRIGMSETTRRAVGLFWEYAAFIGNSLIFLLIGLQMQLDVLAAHWHLIALGIAAILLSRAAVVYLLCPLVSSQSRPIPWSWRHLLVWGGLRGSLSMALALSLPSQFPQRDAIIVTTFGVVLFTLLVKGLTIEPLVQWLKPEADDASGDKR